MKQEKLHYLDTLKLLFSFMIFWTHFVSGFKPCDESIYSLSGKISFLFHPPFSFFYDSGIALYGFLLIAGFLSSKKNFSSFTELLKSILKRYIRFFVPFFFINLLCLLMYCNKLFLTTGFSEIINPFAGLYYNHDPGFREIIRSFVFLGGDLNGPLWMMKYLFLGTVIIYIFNYFSRNSSHRNVLLLVYTLSCLLLFYNVNDQGISDLLVTSLGLPVFSLYEKLKSWKESKNIGSSVSLDILFSVLALVPIFLEGGLLQHFVYPLSVRFLPGISCIFIWNKLYCLLFSFLLVLNTGLSDSLKKLLSLKIFNKISPISFPVYLIHWPLICSASILFFFMFRDSLSYTVLFLTDALVTFLMLVLLSFIYLKTLDRIETSIIKILTSLI